MMSSWPRYDGDKPNKIHLFKSHQAIFWDCSPHAFTAFTLALLKGRQKKNVLKKNPKKYSPRDNSKKIGIIFENNYPHNSAIGPIIIISTVIL